VSAVGFCHASSRKCLFQSKMETVADANTGEGGENNADGGNGFLDKVR